MEKKFKVAIQVVAVLKDGNLIIDGDNITFDVDAGLVKSRHVKLAGMILRNIKEIRYAIGEYNNANFTSEKTDDN